jgi:hypothetical protein
MERLRTKAEPPRNAAIDSSLSRYMRTASSRNSGDHFDGRPIPADLPSSAQTPSIRTSTKGSTPPNAWEYVTPFLAFPPELRRVVYTTNAIEALNRQLRKAIKTKSHFPNEEAARKLIYLAITNAVPAWTRTRNWTTALTCSPPALTG